MLDEARDLYRSVIVERSRTPRHGSRLAAFDTEAREVNPMCGDRCQVFVRRDAEARIGAIGFEARGCAISIASADLMADVAPGLDADGAHRLRDAVERMARAGETRDVPDALLPLAGLHAYPSRITCAMLPWEALIAALHGSQEPRDE